MRLIGYSTEEVMGRSLVQEFITDDFKIAVQAVLDQALAGDETDNFEFPLITKGRARIEVLLNATTRRDEQGNVIGESFLSRLVSGRIIAINSQIQPHNYNITTTTPLPQRCRGHRSGHHCPFGSGEGIFQAH